jgi:hypothetical protein
MRILHHLVSGRTIARTLVATLLIAGVAALTPLSAAAQVRPCLSPDANADAVQKTGVTILTDTAASWRDFRAKIGLPTGSAADVSVVQDNAVCEALTAALDARGNVHLPEAAVVVRIRQTSPIFYVAMQRLPGGDGTMYVVDSAYVRVVDIR